MAKRSRTDSDPYEPSDWAPSDETDLNPITMKEKKDKYKKYYERSNREVLDLRLKVNDLNDQVKKLKKEKEDFDKKSRGIDNYIKVVREKDNNQKTEIDELKKKYEAAKTSCDSKEAEVNEKVKLMELLGKTITNKKNELDKTKETIAELNREIQRLNDLRARDQQAYKLKETMVEKYKDMYQKAKMDMSAKVKDLIEKDKGLKEKDKQINKLTEEIKSLKQQRKYFETHNNNHKLQLLGTITSMVKTKEVYVNGIRQVAKDGININQEFAQKLIEMITQLASVTRDEYIDRVANTITENQDKVLEIEAAEKSITEKRPDKRFKCPSCDQTFASPGDLKTHLTVAHKINYNDRHKNNIPVIQLE